MNTTLYRRIAAAALLASSAGFAAFTLAGCDSDAENAAEDAADTVGDAADDAADAVGDAVDDAKDAVDDNTTTDSTTSN